MSLRNFFWIFLTRESSHDNNHKGGQRKPHNFSFLHKDMPIKQPYQLNASQLQWKVLTIMLLWLLKTILLPWVLDGHISKGKKENRNKAIAGLKLQSPEYVASRAKSGQDIKWST